MDAESGERRSTDRQVTGSYRIETREIEQVLGEHPAISQEYHPIIKRVVVIVREDTLGQKRLIAYVVPQPGHRCSAADLRDWARRRLPEYMIPQTLILMTAMPLNPRGEIDRGALPLPGPNDPPDIGFDDQN